ncbi:hypothetical protein MMC26_005286 [Xylographa opegraphella]|nr:hypothetical protein [Xylographa opegraphella]
MINQNLEEISVLIRQSLVHTKSELSLQDENTKLGTEIDGVRIKGEKTILKNDQHMFKLGSYEHLFRIKWKPVVFSFTFPTKDTKGGRDPLIPARSRLEELDIKTIVPYIVDATTHVVAAKRNTAKGLQALINGKYIVDNSYLDALVYATTPGNLDEPESVSPLEEDYMANWPSPRDHLPAPGREPGQRSSELFDPNPDRGEVFLGYTFVFCNLRQFENLQAPINNGAGKALLFTITNGETLPDEVIRYVKNVAGEKGLGEFEDGSEGKGVVVVRFQGDKGFEDWAIELQNQIALTLDQRLVEQNEFLDAILMNHATKLRRPLPHEYDNDTIANPPIIASSQPAADSHTQHEAVGGTRAFASSVVSQAPPRRVRPRGKIVSAFKGFEDDFDESKVVREESSAGVSSNVKRLPVESVSKSINGSLLVDSQVDLNSQEADIIVTQETSSRKRPLASDEEDEYENNKKLLPAAAAMKRRRIEEEEEAEHRGFPIEPSVNRPHIGTGAVAKQPKARKQIDIQEVVRERREAEEAAARRDEEDLKTTEGVDITRMKNLAVVGEMELYERNDRPPRKGTNGQNGERWDERWNGRKNFKKFQRQGQGEQRRRGPSVIVPLEEVKNKSHGIGEEYWLESEKSKRKRKEKERTTQSQSQPFITVRRTEEIPAEPASGTEREAIDLEMLGTTQLVENNTPSDSASVPSRTLNAKRSAPEGTSSQAQKRQKAFVSRRSDTDSEEDLKFRFKKRR